MISHHYGANYLSYERWLSFVTQVSSLSDIDPQSVLEIGIGPGVKKMMIESTYQGCTYTGVDIDADLSPDVRSDVRILPFTDDEFDATFCCQVLEHIPYEDFLIGLKELQRVTRKRVVISLPDVRPFFFLRARPPSSRRYLPWLWKGISVPSLFPKTHVFEEHGQHYWEIGKKNYPFKRIYNDIESLGWKKTHHFRMIERNYWHFFILDNLE